MNQIIKSITKDHRFSVIRKLKPKFINDTKTATGSVVCAFHLEGQKTLSRILYKNGDEVMDTFLDIYNHHKNKTGNPMFPEDVIINSMFEFSSKNLSFSFKSRYRSGDIDTTEITKVVVLRLSTEDWSEFCGQFTGLDTESNAPCFERSIGLIRAAENKIKCKFLKELLS